MSVFKRGKVYWYEFVFNGGRVRKSTKQGNQTTARQMEASHRASLAKGEFGIFDRKDIPTLRQFVPRFMDAIRTQCASKPNTVDFYDRKTANLLKYNSIADKPLDAIDERTIDNYKRDRARVITRHKKLLSPASINRELATLRRLIRLAHEWRVINRVPRIRLLRGEKIREYIVSSDHEKLYFGTATGDLHDVAALLLETGLRAGEALTLDWTSVRLDPASGARFGHLTVRAKNSKSSKPRNVPLTSKAAEILSGRGVKRAGLVFQRDGSPLVLTRLDQQHRRLRKLLKLPEDFVLHSFRHTYGTRLGEAGADAFTIMRLMGHSTVVVSQRYVHPTPETLESAVERMELLSTVQSGRKLRESPQLPPQGRPGAPLNLT
jgi:integrase